VDLNLMVSKMLGAVNARVERLRDTLSVQRSADQSMVVFSLDAPLELETEQGSGMLEAWDLAVIHGAASRSVRIVGPSRPGPGASARVFLATFHSEPSVLVRREQ
jgi:hypothetical protein